ncbi:hypothetical protein TNCV_1064061 [Trichonephila clavipes]|nr:hypothetical protein TNCV_1064061 [Trichonephila clavipes]
MPPRGRALQFEKRRLNTLILYSATNVVSCRCLVVKFLDSWLVCHEFDPSTIEDPRCREGRSTLIRSTLKCPPVDVDVKRGMCQLRYRLPRLTKVRNYEAFVWLYSDILILSHLATNILNIVNQPIEKIAKKT